jgi:G3E family GTPase
MSTYDDTIEVFLLYVPMGGLDDVEPTMIESRPTPITLISGFLGAGKTTLLKHILENKTGLKVGVIVNDMASINIDASLISLHAGNTAGGTLAKQDTVEVSNGCLCCTAAADELLGSIAKLAHVAKKRGIPWDHIVIEASGVAEPREVRDNLAGVQERDSTQLNGAVLHTLVTVVDSSTFLAEFEKRNTVEQRSDLGVAKSTDGDRQVVDLMCEQIEVADIVVLNKTDLVSKEHLALLTETISKLNPLAKILDCERGRVELGSILAAAASKDSIAKSDEDKDMRRLVEHIQKHGQQHAEQEEHGHRHSEACTDHCADTRTSAHEQECSHGHSHESDHHDHAHDHAHDHTDTGRHATRFGITSFVYQRRLPFHPRRLMQLIRQLPVHQEKLALAKSLDGLGEPGESSSIDLNGDGQGNGSAAGRASNPLDALIRSKGFVWLSNYHSQKFAWAHGGKHFELTPYAAWWECVPKDEWPCEQEEVDVIMKDFDGEFGDRRQELVFIGVRMDQAAIIKLFDDCLLSDSELNDMRAKRRIVEARKRVYTGIGQDK